MCFICYNSAGLPKRSYGKSKMDARLRGGHGLWLKQGGNYRSTESWVWNGREHTVATAMMGAKTCNPRRGIGWPRWLNTAASPGGSGATRVFRRVLCIRRYQRLQERMNVHVHNTGWNTNTVGHFTVSRKAHWVATFFYIYEMWKQTMSQKTSLVSTNSELDRSFKVFFFPPLQWFSDLARSLAFSIDRQRNIMTVHVNGNYGDMQHCTNMIAANAHKERASHFTCSSPWECVFFWTFARGEAVFPPRRRVSYGVFAGTTGGPAVPGRPVPQPAHSWKSLFESGWAQTGHSTVQCVFFKAAWLCLQRARRTLWNCCCETDCAWKI